MPNPTPNLTVPIDLTNPGQFFACCGLLELADRLWPGAEGWFEDNTFLVRCNPLVCHPNDLVGLILQVPEFAPSRTKKIASNGSTMKLLPLSMTLGGSAIAINWWRNELKNPPKHSKETCSKSSFKTWAGNQSPQQIVYDQLLPALRRVVSRPNESWFESREPLSGRFGFDFTASVQAIDCGWSPDKLDMPVSTSPAIELLAMIGLQRFRPVPTSSRSSFRYSIWHHHQVLCVAATLAAGLVESCPGSDYVFEIRDRGDYKYFDRASPVEKANEIKN